MILFPSVGEDFTELLTVALESPKAVLAEAWRLPGHISAFRTQLAEALLHQAAPQLWEGGASGSGPGSLPEGALKPAGRFRLLPGGPWCRFSVAFVNEHSFLHLQGALALVRAP